MSRKIEVQGRQVVKVPCSAGALPQRLLTPGSWLRLVTIKYNKGICAYLPVSLIELCLRKFTPIAVLFLLCLLWAAESLRSDLFPASTGRINLPPLIGEALVLGVLSVLATLAASVRKSRRLQRRVVRDAALVSLGLFVLPSLLIEFGKSWISDYTRIAIFSLTPLLTIVFDPFLGTNEDVERRREFAPAIVTCAGSLLVFPLDIPYSATSFLAFCGVLAASASVAAANCLAVRRCQSAEVSTLTFSAVTAGFGACCLAGLGVVLAKEELRAAPIDAWAALDLLALALLFWLMKHMSALRMTTRFLIAPLLANLIGLALLRPHVPWQAWLGLLMIAVSSAQLLFARAESPEANRTLLRLD